MTRPRPKVLLVCSREVRDLSFLAEDLERLSAVAAWEWLELETPESAPRRSASAALIVIPVVPGLTCAASATAIGPTILRLGSSGSISA